MTLTIKEYIKKKKFKPLSKKELKKGKEEINISNTDDPMPWDRIYADISIGKPIEHIIEEYGHARKICLWAEHDEIDVNPALTKLVNEEAEHRSKMNKIAEIAPNIAVSIEEAVNAYAPNLAQEVAALSKSLIKRGQKLVQDADSTGNELLAIAKMMQTVTDTTGHTQRHASAVSINNNSISVEGFDFVEDKAPMTLEEVIDVKEDD